MGVGGSFAIASTSSADAAQWVMAHRVMFGLPAGVVLHYLRQDKFYEFRWQDDVNDGVSYRYVPSLEGFNFEGNEVVVTLVLNKATIRGVYNGLRPTTVSTYSAPISSSAAWQVTEASAGPLKHAAAKKILLDLQLLLTSVPKSSKVFWMLTGQEGTTGATRQSFVDAETGTLGWISPSKYGFDLNRRNVSYRDNAGPAPDVGVEIYSSVIGQQPTTCLAGTNCTDPAKTQSHSGTRQPTICGTGYTEPIATIAPAVVEAWHQYSILPPTVPAPQTYPGFICSPTDGCFNIPFRKPVDFDNRQLTVVVADHYKDTSGAITRPDSLFPVSAYQGTTLFFAHRKNEINIFGHEYGHYIDQLVMGNTGAPATSVSGYNYTESMMDALGISVDGLISISRAGSGQPLGNTFSLNTCSIYECPDSNHYATCGSPVLYTLAMTWPSDSGDCGDNLQYGQRKAFGSTMYASWQWLSGLVGTSAITQDYRYYFRAWMSNILRSYSLTKTLAPSFMDFYSATVSRYGGAAIANSLHGRLLFDLEATRQRANGQECFR